MSRKKRLILNLFEMNCVSHITHGLWRLPDNNRERFDDLEEAYQFGEGVLPELTRRGRWRHPAPGRQSVSAVPFGGVAR